MNDSIIIKLSLTEMEGVGVFDSDEESLIESEGVTEKLGDSELLKVSLFDRLKLLLSEVVSLSVEEVVVE